MYWFLYLNTFFLFVQDSHIAELETQISQLESEVCILATTLNKEANGSHISIVFQNLAVTLNFFYVKNIVQSITISIQIQIKAFSTLLFNLSAFQHTYLALRHSSPQISVDIDGCSGEQYCFTAIDFTKETLHHVSVTQYVLEKQEEDWETSDIFQQIRRYG